MSEASDGGRGSHQSLENEVAASLQSRSSNLRPIVSAIGRANAPQRAPPVMPMAAPPSGFPLPNNNNIRAENRTPEALPSQSGGSMQNTNYANHNAPPGLAAGPGHAPPGPPLQGSGNTIRWHIQNNALNGSGGNAGSLNIHGGYRGPQLQPSAASARPWHRNEPPNAATPSPPPENDDSGEDLIRRFTQAIHAVPHDAVPGQVPNQNQIGNQNQADNQGPSAGPDYGLTAEEKEADFDIRRIHLLVMHRKTLVANLNEMLRLLHLGTGGTKKMKQERILIEGNRLFVGGDYKDVRNMRKVVEKFAPMLNLDKVPSLSQYQNVAAVDAHAQRPFTRPPPSSAVEPPGFTAAGARVTPGRDNPLVKKAPLVELSFRMSPFYRLEQPLRPPLLFLKPYRRRRISQVVPLDCDYNMLQDPNARVFLVCQEYNPRAGDQQPIYFPFYNEIEVDDKAVTANTRGVRGVPGSARPVDLTPLMVRFGRQKIKITIIVNDQAEATSSRSFAFGLYYGRKVPHEALIEELKARPHINLEQTKKLAMQAAMSDEADDLVISSTAVYSLKDNVMMTRMQIPIRSRACLHIECFDAETFVMLQDQAETWKCPICNKTITWESLAVDDFFSQILSQAGADVETVSIKPDGSWSVEELNSDSTDDDSDSDDGGKQSSKRARTKNAEAEEVVDLLSDSDEETEASSRQAAAEATHPAPGSIQPSSQLNSQLNGQQLNGQQLNGQQLSGQKLNGQQPNGQQPNGQHGNSFTPLSANSQTYREQAAAEWAANAPADMSFRSRPEFRSSTDPTINQLSQRVGDHPGTPINMREPEGPDSGVNANEGASEDVARREIYATLQAFHKSQNLMFEKPLKVTENFESPPENTTATVATPHMSQLLSLLRSNQQPQQPTPPTQSPPATMGESMSSMSQKAHYSSSTNYAGISRIINDADEDDDIIDLTSD